MFCEHCQEDIKSLNTFLHEHYYHHKKAVLNNFISNYRRTNY